MIERIQKASSSLLLSRFISNKNQNKMKFPNLKTSLNSENMGLAYDSISTWPNYKPTNLRHLNKVANFCGVRSVLYKDESERFDLGSFKALGGSYAIAQLAESYKARGQNPSKIIVTTATDGNHGRSVSWGAKLIGCAAKIFIHADVSIEREKAMADLGADVIRVNGNYEASLAACKTEAESNDWIIVSDTSWKGYREIPMQIMAGYSFMSREIIEQMGTTKPSHIFLPVGVGGLAAGVVAPMWEKLGSELGKIVSVESHFSPCFLQSIANGVPTAVDIKNETLMACLSCGEVSEIAWEILKPTLSHCMSIGDNGIPTLMRLFADCGLCEDVIEAGECSASGLAALLLAKSKPKIWKDLQFDKHSNVLLIGTEGATDPILYENLISEGS